MKRITVLLSALLLLCSAVTAGAEEYPEYAGPIDNFTGQPLENEGGDAALLGGDTVYVAKGVNYDRRNRMFMLTSGSEDVYANIASGIVTTEPVQLYLPTGMVYLLYRDGQSVSDANAAEITQPGSYVLMQSMNGRNTEIMRFTIIHAVTGKLSSYTVPAGFSISSVSHNGAPMAYNGASVSLAEEGEYVINYRCAAAETLYSVSFLVDHTPPVLALHEVDERGIAKGPVDISDLEEGADIGIWVNGEPKSYAEKLTGSGVYRLVLSDEAGNLTEYHFTIRVYLNISAMVLFLLLLAALAGLGIYVLYSRRHVRIM